MAGGFSLCSGEVKQLSRKQSWGVRGQGLSTFLALWRAHPNIPFMQLRATQVFRYG